MRYALAGIALALGLVVGPGIASAEVIKEIIVQDNTKTTSDTVALIAQIDTGDDWSVDMIGGIKSRLESSGLFKEVEVFSSQMEGGVRVTILVKDKHSWVIAPAFYNQPTNKGAGVGFGENNLFGHNQKLLIYGQIASGDTFFIGAYQVPSIAGTRFYAQFDTYLKQSRIIEYAAPDGYLDSPTEVRESRMNYLNAGVRLGVELFRGVRLDTRLRGAKVSFPSTSLFNDQPSLRYLGKDPANQDADLGGELQNPGEDGYDVTNEIALTIDNRANFYGVTTGRKYQLVLEHSLESLGSDFEYYLFSASYFRAWQVLERHNFILRVGFNYGHHLPFQQEFTLGGTSMRGYVNNQFRGDVRALGNAEYSVPLFTILGLGVRGLAFWDSGFISFLTNSNPERHYLPNARLEDQDKFGGFKNSVGAGIRLNMRQLVLPLLGVDFGYGLEARDYQIYLAIGLTD